MPDARGAAKIGADICKALAFCHAAGVIHRDVKPENVFVGRFGDYKLGDFGLARRLDEGSRSTKSQAGSGPYMAPEVVTGHYDESVDTYSLGIMLYRWLNGGRPPFIGADETPTRTAIDDAQVRRLSGERPPLPGGQGVDRALAAIVLRACEPKASDRWPSAEALGAALQTWLDGGNVEMGDWAPLDETPRAKAAAATATGSSSRDYDPLSELGATAAAVEARERKAEEREREVRMRAHAEEQRGPSPVESANEQGSREKGNADERRQERVSPQTKTPVVEVPKTSANGTPRPTGVTTGRLIASVLGVVMAGAGILDEYLKGWNEGIIPTLFFLALVLGLTYEMCLRAGSMIDALRTGSKGARTAGVVAVLVGVAAGAFGIYWATGSANNGILTYISLALGGLLLGMTVVSLFTDTSL